MRIAVVHACNAANESCTALQTLPRTSAQCTPMPETEPTQLLQPCILHIMKPHINPLFSVRRHMSLAVPYVTISAAHHWGLRMGSITSLEREHRPRRISLSAVPRNRPFSFRKSTTVTRACGQAMCTQQPPCVTCAECVYVLHCTINMVHWPNRISTTNRALNRAPAIEPLVLTLRGMLECRTAGKSISEACTCGGSPG